MGDDARGLRDPRRVGAAGAAGGVTAAEIAALFADLPAPHPALPVSPLARRRRHAVIVGAVAVLVLDGLLGFVIGRGQAGPPASSGAVVAAPSLPPAVPPTGSAAPPPEMPDDVAVRRTTGPGLITLARPPAWISTTWPARPGTSARGAATATSVSRPTRVGCPWTTVTPW